MINDILRAKIIVSIVQIGYWRTLPYGFIGLSVESSPVSLDIQPKCQYFLDKAVFTKKEAEIHFFYRKQL